MTSSEHVEQGRATRRGPAAIRLTTGQALLRFLAAQFVERDGAEHRDPAVRRYVGPLLTFDPQQERFGNNNQANALLTRQYRAPFVVPGANA